MIKSDQTKSAEEQIDFKVFFSEENLKLEEILELKKKIWSDLKWLSKFEKTVRDLGERTPPELSETKGLTRKGVAYWLLNQFKEAQRLLEQAEANQERDYFLACVYLQQRFYHKAYKLLDELYKNTPETLCIVFSYIEAKIKIGQVKETLSLLEKLYKQYRDEPDLSYFTGRCYEYLGDYDRASKEYQHALRIAPNHTRTLFHLAYRLDLEGKDEQALELYKQLAAAKPTHIGVLLNLGILYEDFGKYKEAIKCYQTILKFYPNHPEAQLYLKNAMASEKMYYDEETRRREVQLQRLLATPISDFQLSSRVRTAMETLNIKTLGDLVKKTEEDLLACENFAQTSLFEVKEILARKGLSLAPPRVSSAFSPSESIGLTTKPLSQSDILNKPLSDFNWSKRTQNCFNELKLYTIGDLVSKTEQELLKIRNFGQASLKEIKQKLASFGLVLKVAVD